MPKKDAGLAAIARSNRSVRTRKTAPAATKSAQRTAQEKPGLVFEGQPRKTSLDLDRGLWNCVLDTAHVLTQRARVTGQSRVTLTSVLEAAFVAFHELPIEQQIELVRKRL